MISANFCKESMREKQACNDSMFAVRLRGVWGWTKLHCTELLPQFIYLFRRSAQLWTELRTQCWPKAWENHTLSSWWTSNPPLVCRVNPKWASSLERHGTNIVIHNPVRWTKPGTRSRGKLSEKWWGHSVLAVLKGNMYSFLPSLITVIVANLAWWKP